MGVQDGAGATGGAVYQNSDILSGTNCVFEENTATQVCIEDRLFFANLVTVACFFCV